jgi:hypothetical protein
VAVKLNASTASTFDLTAGGTITVSGVLSASNISLVTTNNGGIAIAANLGVLGTTVSTTLQSNGSGAITQTAGLVYGSTSISLSTGTNGYGNIGGSATAPIKLDTAGTITSMTGTNGGSTLKLGSTFLSNSSSGGATLSASSQSGGAYSMTATGSLTVDGVTTNAPTSTANGNVTIVAGGTPGGTLTIDGNVTANGGSITLENSNITASTNSSIVIDAGTDIHASSTLTTAGKVNIVMGAVPTSPTNKTTPSGVTPSGTGTIYYGTTTSGVTSSIDAVPDGGSIFVQADGRNIIFNTGKLPNSAITIYASNGSNTTITADPPAAGTLSSQSNVTATPSSSPSSASTSSSSSSQVGSSQPLGNQVTAGSIGFSAANAVGSISNMDYLNSAAIECTDENIQPIVGKSHVKTVVDAPGSSVVPTDELIDTGDCSFDEAEESVATAEK